MTFDDILSVALPIVIIGGLVIAIICKSTGQTLPELLSGIKDFMVDKKDDVQDSGLGNYSR
jgi:hypothetical protein